MRRGGWRGVCASGGSFRLRSGPSWVLGSGARPEGAHRQEPHILSPRLQGGVGRPQVSQSAEVLPLPEGQASWESTGAPPSFVSSQS